MFFGSQKNTKIRCRNGLLSPYSLTPPLPSFSAFLPSPPLTHSICPTLYWQIGYKLPSNISIGKLYTTHVWVAPSLHLPCISIVWEHDFICDCTFLPSVMWYLPCPVLGKYSSKYIFISSLIILWAQEQQNYTMHRTLGKWFWTGI